MFRRKFLFGRLPYFNVQSGSDVLGGDNSDPNPNPNPGNSNQYPSTFGDGITDTALINTIASNKWNAPVDAVKSFAELQTKHTALEAAKGIPLPGDKATPQDWDNFYKAVGRPETADKYDIAKMVPEKADQTFAKEAANWFHKAGLSQKQAETLSTEWNTFNKATLEAQELEFSKNAAKEFGELQIDWGKDFDNNNELGRRAVRFLQEQTGFKPEQLEPLERAVGTKTMMKMMNTIGKMLQDAKAPDGSPRIVQDANTARAKINQLRADPEFQKRYHNENSIIRNAAINEMEALAKVAYGDAPNA